jgi:dihydroflavonol-4-reductase
MSKYYMFFDGSKAVRELGLPQSPIEPAFERAVGWFVDHSYVPATKSSTARSLSARSI